MLENPPTITAEADDAVVYVIQSNYHHRDRNDYFASDEELLVDEGWFADADSAAVRCEQLNAQNQLYYETNMATRRRRHEAKVRVAKKANKEAAAIRAAGMKKADVPLPEPFEPETFEKFFSESNHTTYEAVEVRRSDHDGIARARAARPGSTEESKDENSTEGNTAKGAAPRTA